MFQASLPIHHETFAVVAAWPAWTCALQQQTCSACATSERAPTVMYAKSTSLLGRVTLLSWGYEKLPCVELIGF